MVLPLRSATDWMLSPASTMYSTPIVFSAASCTPPCVLLYRVAATLVGTAAMSSSPDTTLATTSSGAVARVT